MRAPSTGSATRPRFGHRGARSKCDPFGLYRMRATTSVRRDLARIVVANLGPSRFPLHPSMTVIVNEGAMAPATTPTRVCRVDQAADWSSAARR